MDPITGAMIASFITSLFGGRGGNSSPSANSSQDMTQLLSSIPELREALNLQTTQAKRQDPLHSALTQLAINFLPKSAFTTYAGRPDISGITSSFTSPGSPGSAVPRAGTSPGNAGSGSSPGFGNPNSFGANPRDPYLNGRTPFGPKGPGLSPEQYRLMDEMGWRNFFSGNPYGAFFGGSGGGGTGDQFWTGGGHGRPKAF